jgi:chemotaxis protein CheX
MARTKFFERMVLDSCPDVFSAYRVSLERKPASPMRDGVDSPDVSSGGLLGFSGEGVSGSLLIVASFEFLAGCRPPALRTKTLTPSSSTDWILVRDWAMELANQLVGRIRNKLYLHGIALDQRCPTAVSGHALAVSIRSRRNEPLQFATPGKQCVRVWIDATVQPSFESAVASKLDPPPTVPNDGEVLVF